MTHPLPKEATFALLTVGGFEFCVHADLIVQVVPRPPALVSMPNSKREVVGLLPFRGRAVPVIDLRLALGTLSDIEPGFVMVLAQGGLWMGVLVDRPSGLARVQRRAVQRVHHDAEAQQLFHTVVSRGAGLWTPVLDAERLLHWGQAWATGTRHSQNQDVLASHLLTAVFEVSGELFGLAGSAVAEVLARPSVEKLPAMGRGLIGFIKWRGLDVPVVDPGHELGTLPTFDMPPYVVVLHWVEDRVPIVLGLPCERLDEVRRIDSSTVQSVGTLLGLCGPACRGIHVLPDQRQIKMVDVARLAGTLGIRTLVEPETTDKSRAETNRQAFVAFQAGHGMALPISTLQEIVSVAHLPETIRLVIAKGGPRRSMLWRGKVVPLLDLKHSRSLPDTLHEVQLAQHVIIATSENGLLGLLVDAVDTLIPPFQGKLSRARLPDGRPLELIAMQRDGARERWHVVDLEHLVGTLQAQRREETQTKASRPEAA